MGANMSVIRIVVFAGGGLAIASLWLISLVEVLTNADRYRNGTQLIWVLVLLVSGPIGAVLYQSLGPIRSPLGVDASILEEAGVDALVLQERDREKFAG